MKSKHMRRTVAEFAVGLLACTAIQMFVITPADTRLAAVQAEAEAAARPGGQGPNFSAAQMNDLTQQGLEHAARVRELSRVAFSETELFGRLMSLARDTHVRIDQLQPSSMPITPTKGNGGVTGAPAMGEAPGVGGPPADVPKDGANGYAMTVTASYANLQQFLQMLRSNAGYVVVRSVRLQPDPEQGRPETRGSAEPLVRAQIQTEHHWFDVSRLEKLSGKTIAQTEGLQEGH